MARTAPALDLDALIGGFRPLFRALDPQQVNALSGQLISALQGQGATINSFLAQTAALTSTLADRDQLIGQVVNNLNVVLGSLGDQSDQFAKAVDVAVGAGARAQRTAGRTSATRLAYTNAAAASIADLLAQARPPFAKTVHETDRAAGIVVADHDYFDNLLNTLPDAYQALARQGIYGDFFSFYLCDIVLKLNGKGGQPVYVKVAGQSHGEVRAEMKPFTERNPLVIGADRAGADRRRRDRLRCNYDKLPFFDQGKEYSAYFADAGGLTTGAATCRFRASRWARCQVHRAGRAARAGQVHRRQGHPRSGTAPRRRSRPRVCWAPRCSRSPRAVTAS